MPNERVAPLFEEARKLRLGFVIGYAELDRQTGSPKRFDSCVLVDQNGTLVAKYRKVHLPGYFDFRPR